MLLYFKTRNSRSFADNIEFSMIATDDYETLPNNIVWLEQYNVAVLKSCILYGGNASGKSNLLKAMVDSDRIIRRSRDAGEVFPFNYSKHRPKYNERPISYVYGILINGIHYEYSFAHNHQQIFDEKLLKYLPGEKYPQLILQRSFNPLKQEFHSRLAPELEALKGLKEYVEYLNASELILEKIASRDNAPSDIADLFGWFQNHFRYNLDLGTPILGVHQALGEMEENHDLKKRILHDWLPDTDLLISDIVFKEEEDETGKTKTTVETKHYGDNPDVDYSFFNEESIGTQQLIGWIVPWLLAFEHNWTFLIDEFGNNLHPRLTNYSIQKFHAESDQAQLIFTTHDTSILNSGLMRNDQIWFVNRDRKGNSTIEPFAHYDIPDDRLLNHVYLQGILGGVPHIRAKGVSNVESIP